MRALVKRVIPKRLRRLIQRVRGNDLPPFARESFSQDGEDMVLERFLENRSGGFYVDVGAHHPERFSNTYRLYRRGWRGLNIDAIPGGMEKFREIRPRDINIEAAIAAERSEFVFYMFNDHALNTFQKELALERVGGPYRITKEVTLATKPLSDLLNMYVPTGTKIDLLTVDVEGLDLDVLQSNDWERYRPEFVLAECLGAATTEEALAHQVCRFLAGKGYSMVAKTMNTVVFRLLSARS